MPTIPRTDPSLTRGRVDFFNRVSNEFDCRYIALILGPTTLNIRYSRASSAVRQAGVGLPPETSAAGSGRRFDSIVIAECPYPERRTLPAWHLLSRSPPYKNVICPTLRVSKQSSNQDPDECRATFRELSVFLEESQCMMQDDAGRSYS
jgi:hypothetical protein